VKTGERSRGAGSGDGGPHAGDELEGGERVAVLLPGRLVREERADELPDVGVLGRAGRADDVGEQAALELTGVLKRRAGSRSRAVITTWASTGSTMGFSADGEVICRSCTARSTATSLSPSKRREPVRSSQRVMPRAKRSVRESTGSPRACSGAMYANLPFSIPAVLARLLALAMPKSVSFTAPSKETRTLCGVTSRWTRPSDWPWSVSRCA
jgi:hypothetical protein